MTLIKIKTKKKKNKPKISRNYIKKVMKEKGIKSVDLCTHLDMDKAHVSKIINGNVGACISLPVALKISKFLGVPVEQLFKQ